MDWLTRGDIDRITANLSADDLIESGLGTEGVNSMKAMRDAFDAAALREGIEGAAKRVRVSDFQHWAEALGGAVNIDNPLSDDTESLLGSADTGE